MTVPDIVKPNGETYGSNRVAEKMQQPGSLDIEIERSVENEQVLESLALEAWNLAKNELAVSLRFMNSVFYALAFLPAPDAGMATDGRFVRFNPRDTLLLYRQNPAALTRGYLHMVLHNVFLHPFVGEDIQAHLWDLACDIAVEHTIEELALPCCASASSAQRQAFFAQLQESLPLITAETVYRRFCDENLSTNEADEIGRAFRFDDHAPWHAMRGNAAHAARKADSDSLPAPSHAPALRSAKGGIRLNLPENEQEADFVHKAERAARRAAAPVKEAPLNSAKSTVAQFANTVNLDRTREQWEHAAYETGVQLSSYMKLWGAQGEHLSLALQTINRKKRDYKSFLRTFAQIGEHLRINDDEYDYVYYCYGLTRYGNLPLIEPLEYAEEKRIRSFVIAIDTSASTRDGLVQAFLERTYHVLAQESAFFAHLEVHIVQCDAALTDVCIIRSLAEFDTYLHRLEIKGLGGTDFRPVFDYIDEQREQGRLQNLGGLLYFTDGCGTHPKQTPLYKVAYVFADAASAACAPPVPSWAISAVLD